MAPDAQADALYNVAERARALANADRCTIYEVDVGRGEIFSRVALGLAAGEEIRVSLTRGVIGFVARTGQAIRLRDVHNDPRFDPTIDERTGYVTRGLLCLPVLNSHGDVRGAIQVINKLEGAFSEADEAAIAALAPEIESLLG